MSKSHNEVIDDFVRTHCEALQQESKRFEVKDSEGFTAEVIKSDWDNVRGRLVRFSCSFQEKLKERVWLISDTNCRGLVVKIFTDGFLLSTADMDLYQEGEVFSFFLSKCEPGILEDAIVNIQSDYVYR